MMIPLLPFPDSNIFRQPHPPNKKNPKDVEAPVGFLNPKSGNEVEKLGLADGMFFAPLTIEGPKEAN